MVKKRFFRLKENLKITNAENFRCYLTDGRSVGKKCPERFDHVLLHAPFSSEAHIHPTDTLDGFFIAKLQKRA
ncbi:MAG: hypothetical protein MJH11_16920 [Lentisphaeria bacterium]|nr:hypothetical protein [Lentisphaeria bacterium]